MQWWYAVVYGREKEKNELCPHYCHNIYSVSIPLRSQWTDSTRVKEEKRGKRQQYSYSLGRSARVKEYFVILTMVLLCFYFFSCVHIHANSDGEAIMVFFIW